MPHNIFHSTSAIAGPAQRTGINEVLRAAVFSTPARVSAGEVVVVVMRAFAAVAAISEWDVPYLRPETQAASRDRCDWQKVHNLLAKKCLVVENLVIHAHNRLNIVHYYTY